MKKDKNSFFRWGALFYIAVFEQTSHAQQLLGKTSESTTSSRPSCLQTVALDPLDLNEALAQAYQHNPSIVAAQGDVEKAKANETIATAAFYPTVNASIAAERYVNEARNNPVTTVGSTVIGGQSGMYSNYPSVSTNWNLYNGGRDLAAYRAAQATTRASSSDLDNKFNDTFTSVLAAYNDLMKAQVLFVEQSDAVKVHDAMVLRSRERFQRNNGTLIALNQARIARAQTERESFKTCRDILDKSAALAKAIGVRLPAGHVLTLTEPLPTVPDDAFNELTIETLIQSDPAVNAAKERKEAAMHKIEQAQGAFYPTLAFTARYDWLGQKQEGFGAAWQNTSDNSYRYGLILQQSLFPFAAYKGGVQSAHADLIKADAEYRDTMVSVETHLRTALNAKTEAEDAELSAQHSAEEARQALLLSKALFAGGQADLDTVARAQLDAGQEEEAADEAKAERVLNDWLVYRALHPTEFATMLLKAAESTSNKTGGIH